MKYIPKMYQDHFGVELIGCKENRELFKIIFSLIIVGLKRFIACAIISSPEIAINVYCLRDELFESLDVLYKCDFNVSAIICDNNQSKLSRVKDQRGKTKIYTIYA